MPAVGRYRIRRSVIENMILGKACYLVLLEFHVHNYQKLEGRISSGQGTESNHIKLRSDW